MVVTSIFIILSAVVLAKNSRFGSVIVLQNLAHDIALSIREAQVYGIAVRRCDADVDNTACNAANQFQNGYGMHFYLGSSYELFADVNKNGRWDPGETVKTTNVSGGYAVTDICAPAGNCSPARVDILFKRPEPDACISTQSSGSTINADGTCTSAIQRAQIVLTSPHADSATITIESSGQISVQ